MTWKQCTISMSASYTTIEDGVALLALSARDTPDIALFSRTTADRRHRVLLLSPLAVELAADVLPSRWTECDAPELFEWDLIFGRPEAYEHLGLCCPKFGKSREPSPIATLGHDPKAPAQDAQRPEHS